jgi:hypothetical protein
MNRATSCLFAQLFEARQEHAGVRFLNRVDTPATLSREDCEVTHRALHQGFSLVAFLVPS